MNQLSFFFVAVLFSSATSFDVKTVSFDEGYSALFGGSNVVRSVSGDSVQLRLDQYTGSGFISLNSYKYGLFSASIKLPADYTAGVVVAFYTSNGDVFDKTHDELDFEFLGNVRGQPWRVQTNIYGNGSMSRGREERYILPFDPTKEAHRYSILWTADNIIFYVDNIPIRVVVRTSAMGGDFPSKPMSLYVTIWDGSTWATAGGKYKANYKYAPFISEFSELVLPGCRTDTLEQLPPEGRCMEAESELATAEYAVMTPRKRAAMLRFRVRYMTYSFCYDTLRYPTAFPDCKIIPSEQRRFRESGNVKFVTHWRRTQRRSRMPKATDPSREADI